MRSAGASPRPRTRGHFIDHAQPRTLMHRVELVDSPAGAERMRRTLDSAGPVAVDCEAAGFHRYSDRLCLVQASVPDRTFVLDPLATPLAGCLRPSLEDPKRPVLMHGASFDVHLLRRDLGVAVAGLVDTQVLASFAGETAVGLQALLESRLGVRVSKRFQRADWAARPLSREMIDYAAGDTRHLHALAETLSKGVRRKGRERWAREECRRIERAAAQPAEKEAVDPVTRVKGARKLDDRTVTALRAALRWRDGIAKSWDRAPFRVVGNEALLAAVRVRPASSATLAAVPGFPRKLARGPRADALVRTLQEIEEMPEKALVPYPATRRRADGPARPDEAVVDRLKDARNRVASALDLERGRLVANSVLSAVAATRPKDLAALAAVPGVRQWQVEALGKELLAALRE